MSSEPAAADPFAQSPPTLRRRIWGCVWLAALPVGAACGNFAVLVLLTHPRSPLLSGLASEALRAVTRGLEKEGVLAALAAPGALAGFAYLGWRARSNARGWAFAAGYAAAAWVVLTLLLIGLLKIARAVL
ncbi:hypothetical protein [Alienimonas californiensis]|uniref:Uncharacterized protein n=1 Tax=Alienimonas californiensis TaxID=2527989 RepID=A0A517P5R7_9PLAN|nr:hypothetical protein [Alienimonas californiensis]QDT14720.1 hypothetical protein CA12_07980 [Alienimonas californiensis]